jgi:hypothetical protein
MTKKNEEYAPAADFPVDDFDLDNDFVPTPLIPQATYRGNIVEVKFEKEKCYLDFSVCLNDNGGVKSDGETPIDGSRLSYKVFLPKPGDEAEMTKSGKQTKKQSKINMLKEFSDKLKLNINSPNDIREAIENGDWIGIDVQVTVEPSEYEGRVFDSIKFGSITSV